jgi:predicted nucleotidyltransferase
MKKIIEGLRGDRQFNHFMAPLDESADFRDATYFLRDDGTFVFSEGYYHQFEKPREERMLNCHIFYVPFDPARPVPDYTRKELFGRTYVNITKEIMTTRPLDLLYPLQYRSYLKVDPSQAKIVKPIYAEYKAWVPLTSLVAAFPHRHSLGAIMDEAENDPGARKIRSTAEHTAELLGIDISRLGISGSLSLGSYAHPHDVDFVIYGSASEVKRIVDFMHSLTDNEEDRRVNEFGKYWPIRFWDESEGERFMVCPFFSYLDPEEAPLRNFDCENLGPAEVEAVISDDTHNAFNPTILMLEKVKLNGKEYPGITRLIIHHGAERGDWREGYRVSVRGYHVRIRTYRLSGGKRELKEEFEAILEGNLGDVKRVE